MLPPLLSRDFACDFFILVIRVCYDFFIVVMCVFFACVMCVPSGNFTYVILIQSLMVLCFDD